MNEYLGRLGRENGSHVIGQSGLLQNQYFANFEWPPFIEAPLRLNRSVPMDLFVVTVARRLSANRLRH